MTEDSKTAWKLVPVEPTEDMTAAAQEAIDSPFYADIERVYRVMLAAAPVNASRSGEDDAVAILRTALETFASARNWHQGGPYDPNSASFVGVSAAIIALDAAAAATPRPSEPVEALREDIERLIAEARTEDKTFHHSYIVDDMRHFYPSDLPQRMADAFDAALATPGLAASRPTVGVPLDISTAPKDGTRILLIGHRGPNWDIGDWGGHGRYLGKTKGWEHCWGNGPNYLGEPTHWMPLPPTALTPIEGV